MPDITSGSIRIITANQINNSRGSVNVKEALYLNSTRNKVVPSTHKDASFLLTPKNGFVTLEDIEKYGIELEDGLLKREVKIEIVKPKYPDCIVSSREGFKKVRKFDKYRKPLPLVNKKVS